MAACAWAACQDIAVDDGIAWMMQWRTVLNLHACFSGLAVWSNRNRVSPASMPMKAKIVLVESK